MGGDSERLRRFSGGALVLSVVACLAVAGCSDIRPEPNIEEGGMVDAPTHEADALREEEHPEGEHQ